MECIGKLTKNGIFMTISFFEQGDVPQPPEKTKIELLNATPSDDGWRVKVEIHVTPFQVRPSLEIALLRSGSEQEKPIAVFSIVETMHPKMEFTLHIRGVSEPQGDYELKAMLYFRESPSEGDETLEPMQIQDQKAFQFSIETKE